jgi:hypothetical protein
LTIGRGRAGPGNPLSAGETAAADAVSTAVRAALGPLPHTEETDTKSAAAQLGHSSVEVTATYYIVKPAQAPDVSDILERLGTDHGRRQRPALARPNEADG